MSSSRHSGVRAVASPPAKAEKSTTLESTPRMFASPRYQDRVSGTPETSGSGSISPASSSLSSQLLLPACTPSRDVGSASVCASRRLICLATVRSLLERRDLGHQFLGVDRLDQVVLGPLPHAPDTVGFLVLARDDDHGNVFGRLVPRDGARRLKAVGARHDHVHKDQIGFLRFGLGNCLVAAFRSDALEAVLGQRFHEKLPVGRRVIHDQYFLNGHWGTSSGTYRRVNAYCFQQAVLGERLGQVLV